VSKAKKENIKQILKVLRDYYPGAKCDLDTSNPWQLLVSTMLSAQATDKSVMAVTPNLFKKYKSVKAMSEAKAKDVEKIIKKVGLSPTKSRNVVATAKILKSDYRSRVPDVREELVKLPGVGRKTANVVLGNFFGVPTVSVDTHAKRISYRFGLTKNTDVLKIEQDLMKILDKSDWVSYTHLVIRLGREFCKGKTPNCQECVVRSLCKKIL
jgi:endonuclease-3